MIDYNKKNIGARNCKEEDDLFVYHFTFIHTDNISLGWDKVITSIRQVR